MAVVKVVQMEPFKNEQGEMVNYKRLCISGYVGGEIHTLELKLEKSELLLAELLLSTNEEKPETAIRKPTEEEKHDFDSKVKRNKRSNKIELEDDDEIDGELFD